jgi:hypothetical protein
MWLPVIVLMRNAQSAPNEGSLRVEDLPCLVGEGARVLANFILALLASRRRFVARLPDQGSERADQEGDFVPEFLELCQLAHGQGAPQVQIAGDRIEAAVDA